jgi:hypothetical protein
MCGWNKSLSELPYIEQTLQKQIILLVRELPYIVRGPNDTAGKKHPELS